MHSALFPNRRSKDFGKLLEQYVFCLADTFIDQADSETQQKLIRLFIEVDTEPESEPEVVNRNDSHRR